MVGRDLVVGVCSATQGRHTRMACAILQRVLTESSHLQRERRRPALLCDLGEVSAVGNETAEVAMDDETIRSTCVGDGTALSHSC